MDASEETGLLHPVEHATDEPKVVATYYLWFSVVAISFNALSLVSIIEIALQLATPSLLIICKNVLLL